MNLEILKTVMSNTSYQILLWMVAIDIFTGVAKAIKQHRIDSKVSTDGMIRHVLVVIIVTLVSIYGRVLVFESVASSVGYFYIASYGISILENADSIGLKLPSVMSQYFNQMRDDYDHRLAKSLIRKSFISGRNQQGQLAVTTEETKPSITALFMSPLLIITTSRPSKNRRIGRK